MLRRVQRLEAARAAPRSPIEAAYGSLAAFEAQVADEVAAGKLDRIDMAGVIAALRRWHADQVWAGWTRYRNGAWENGQV